MIPYLLAIYRLHKRKNSMVSTGELAEFMGVREASVSEMVAKMSARRYLVVKHHKGFYLTKKGVQEGHKAYRSLKALEALFRDKLGVPVGEAKGIAEAGISYQVTKGIERFLGIRQSSIIRHMDRVRQGRWRFLFYVGHPDEASADIKPEEEFEVIRKTSKGLLIRKGGKRQMVSNSFAAKSYCILR
ncbi:MAG: metal-dependent transcriptional regulator [Candidatus Anstonellales archaeon]